MKAYAQSKGEERRERWANGAELELLEQTQHGWYPGLPAKPLEQVWLFLGAVLSCHSRVRVGETLPSCTCLIRNIGLVGLYPKCPR